MQKRQLGKTGPKISEVGLGCWQLGCDWGDAVNEEYAFEIMSSAVENGVNFFDTADVYGNNNRQSETYIGKFTKQCGTTLQVATKYGRGKDVFPNSYTEAALREGILASQKHLQVDTLDLLQLHCVPAKAMQESGLFDWLRQAKEDGLIRNFGASVESVEEAMICLEQEGLASLQVIFNVFRQKLITDLFPKAQEKGVGIIVRLPLASGLLAGKITESTTFNENDHRTYNRNGEYFNVGETFAGLPMAKGIELSEKVKALLPKEGTMAQQSLRWILDHEAVTTIIPGASSPQQARDNTVAAALPPLSPELHAALTEFYSQEVHEHIRGPY